MVKREPMLQSIQRTSASSSAIALLVTKLKTLLDQLTQGEVLGDEFDVEEEIEATQMGGLIDTEAETPEPEEEPAAAQEEE